MSNTVMIISLVIGLVLTLWLSTKFKINAGILALVVAWIVGCGMGGLSTATLIGYWPSSVMFIAITTALFFGVARENGTLQLFASKIMYACRKTAWFVPIALYITTWVIGASGAGGMGSEIPMSAIGFAIAGQTGMHPLLVILAVFLGGMGGGGMFWSAEGANRIAYYTGIVSDEAVAYSTMAHSVYTVIIYTIIFFIGYFIFKGWKIDTSKLSMEKPAAYNSEQKKTLALTVICLVIVIASSILKCFAPNDTTKFLANMFSIQMVCLAGFVIAWAMKIVEPKNVMKRIPWEMILNIGGMSMMIKVLINCGITEAISNLFATANIPNVLIPAIFFLTAGVITLFSNFTVIYPLLMPLVPVVAAATGCNSVTLFAAMAMGSGLPAVSPFSTGGVCCLSGCPDEETREKLIPKQFIMAWIIMAVSAVLVCTPLLKIFPDCL